MSIPRGYGLNGKSIYANVAKPQLTYLQFTVNAADTGGLGVTSVKSNGYVQSVFMHTSQTPGVVNGITNPNPPAGYVLITFTNSFNYWLSNYHTQYAPPTSTGTTSVTQNSVYVITALGTATTAQWQAKGFPPNMTPAVGAVFVATATGTIGGSATVGVPGLPVAPVLSVVGNPNMTIASSNVAQYGGAQMMLQFASLSFAGSALGTHTHNFTVIGGQAAATTNSIANYAGPIIGKEEATNATYLGANSATNGGVVAASAGTPAGTASYVAASPADSTIVYMQFAYDGSTVTIDGI